MCGVQCKPAPAARVSRAPSFSQPTSETTRCLSLGLACDAIPRINLQFLPGKKDGTAKKIIDQIKRNLATKHQHPEAFPSQRNGVNRVLPVRSEHFGYFLTV